MKNIFDKVINSPYLHIMIIFLIAIAFAVATTYSWFNWQSTDETKLEMKIGHLEPPCVPTPLVPDTGVNAPKLADGMIPVVYDKCKDLWVKANTTSNWYNYKDKKWANAVMVTEGTRTQHLSNPPGTPVPEADILAYLVWIPRYKYQLFNVTYAAITPREIQIEFENGTATTGTILCHTSNLGVETCNNATNGNWYTHPAFTFGEDELTGLWVGKFETSADPTSACFTDSNPINCNNKNQLPRIKPNVNSLRNQQLANQFVTSRKFNSTSYVTSVGVSKIDAHMMKNIEWGVVTYFMHSKYGRCTDGTCTEVYINPSTSYITGRSGNVVSQVQATDTSGSASSNLYGYDGKSCNSKTGYVCTGVTDQTYGPSASTTGNIYGIYDMSGGAFEYTMGVHVSESGVLYSGYDVANNSAFTGILDSTGEIYTGVDFPVVKYYDKYAYGTSYSDYARSHLGDGTGETRSWNNDYRFFADSSSPWFSRGGYFNNSDNAGSFGFSGSSGYATKNCSWRLAIQIK